MYGSNFSLTSALDGGGWHVPADLPPGKGVGVCCIGGWVGHRDGMDGFGKFSFHRDSIPGLSSSGESRYRVRYSDPLMCLRRA